MADPQATARHIQLDARSVTPPGVQLFGNINPLYSRYLEDMLSNWSSQVLESSKYC